MLRIAFSIISSLLLFSCSQKQTSLPYYNTPDFTPLFSNESVTHTIADFSFTDQNGHHITQHDVEGKIHVAAFIFTSCGSICPVMTDNMQTVSNAFVNDSNVVLLSFTVTPWIDSVARLKQYTTTKHITNPNWHFLTGPKSAIYNLARTSYFAEENMGFTKDSTEFLHTEHIILADENKNIRGIYHGTLKLEMEQLIKDIEQLKKAAP